jgi:hypothetical protein
MKGLNARETITEQQRVKSSGGLHISGVLQNSDRQRVRERPLKESATLKIRHSQGCRVSRIPRPPYAVSPKMARPERIARYFREKREPGGWYVKFDI